MKYENIRYFELTFINDLVEVKKQIRNTILFLYLSEKYGLTVLSEYLEGTRYGYTASAKSEGEIKLLRITDISEGNVNWNSVPFCVCDKPDKYLLNNNDILVARTGGTTGKSFIVKNVPTNIVYASYLIRLRLKDENHADFISAFLNSYTYWSQLIELKSGAAQPNVNAEKLKKIIIPKCSPQVQKRFVSYLNGDIIEAELDARINEILALFDSNQSLKEEQSHQLDLLKKLRQQILQDAVQGKLITQDLNDEPTSKLLERIKAEKEKLVREKKIKKEKPLPTINLEEIPFEIPKNWVWCRLGEVIEFTKNKNIHKDLSPDTLINYVDIDAIDNQRYEIRESKIKPVAELSSRARRILRKGFIMYSLVRPYLNNIAIVEEEKKHYIGSTGFVVFSGILVDNQFLKYILLSDYIRKKYLEFLSGFNSPSISYEQFNSTLLPLPSNAEQKRIVNKIGHLMKICDELEQSIQQNQKYTQELLQVALKERLELKV